MTSFNFRLLPFCFWKVTLPNDNIHFLATFTEELSKCFTDSYSIEIPVELTIPP